MAAATDMARYGGNTGLHWLPDGDRIVALVSDAGTVHPCAIDVADGAVSPITAGDFVTAAYSLDDAGQRMAMLLRDGSTPGDIFVVDLAGPLPVAQRGSQTSTVRSWSEIDTPTPRRFSFRGHADLSIDAWMLPPANLAPGEKAPLIYFHGGGPGGMRGGNFMFEYQVLAAAGYAVAWCNAHGCQGYGEAFCTAILGDWGGADFEDILAPVWTALRTVRLCERRAVGHRRGQLRRLSRQLGAGPHRSLSGGGVGSQRLQPHGTRGTSDIGPGREFEFGGGPPWETIDWYLKQSPISYLGNAKTPTLVVHSARDYRCPIEQGEALYLSLQFLGVPTELVRFPDEGHELSRSGKPWHRVFRLEKYVEWFGKWLKGDDEMMG
ncbi:MAG: prolyl oligopeptidase family serine peptidase [Caldilineaceae bacterium]